jgi:hypothetical protein
VSQYDQGEVVPGPDSTSRREVLIRGAALGAMVWAAPAVSRLSAPSAQATPLCAADTSGERVYSTPGAFTFQVPLNVTSITVEVWGGGGAGAAGAGNTGGGGGGGGGYARTTLTVPECETYTL